MARLPNGTIHAVSTAWGTAVSFAASDITNAKPAVVSATAHGLTTGAVVLVESSWGRLDMRAFTIAAIDADTFALDGSDTTNATLYPASSGGGMVKAVSTWVDLNRTLNHSTSGGDAKTVSAKFLEYENEFILNDGFNAITRTFDMDAEELGKAGYEALKTLSENDALTIVRRTSKNGATNYIPARIAFSEEQNLADGQVETVSCTISAQNKSTSYAPAP